MELENQEQGAQFKEKVKFDAPAQTLEESLNKLVKFGGFDFLESTIDGVANMNPERKARKKIFLSEADKKAERKYIQFKSGGTGFLIDGKGYLVTNAHIIRNSINIAVFNNKGEEFNAVVLKTL